MGDRVTKGRMQACVTVGAHHSNKCFFRQGLHCDCVMCLLCSKTRNSIAYIYIFLKNCTIGHLVYSIYSAMGNFSTNTDVIFSFSGLVMGRTLEQQFMSNEGGLYKCSSFR